MSELTIKSHAMDYCASAEEYELNSECNSEMETAFTPVINKRHRMSPVETAEDEDRKKMRLQEAASKTNRFLYVAGGEENIVTFAKSKPILLKKELNKIAGSIEEIKLTGNAIRLTCTNPAQKAKLMATTTICGKTVRVTEPRSINKDTQQSVKGVIFAIPDDVTEDELREELGATSVRRLIKNVSGVKTATGTVIFSIDSDNLPEYVYVGLLRKKVSEYVPAPYRCYKCQRFGHKSTNCRSAIEKCTLCSEDHSYHLCPNATNLKCANCAGSHSTASPQCPKYIEVKETLQLKTTNKISYSAAVKLRRQQPASSTTPTTTTTTSPATQLSTTSAQRSMVTNPSTTSVQSQPDTSTLAQGGGQRSPTSNPHGQATPSCPLPSTANTQVQKLIQFIIQLLRTLITDKQSVDLIEKLIISIFNTDAVQTTLPLCL